MPELVLTARSALGDGDTLVIRRQDLVVEQATDGAMVSLAARKDRADALEHAVRDAYGLALPGPGRMAWSGPTGFAWSGPGRWFVHAEGTGDDLCRALAAALGDHASITDQSDAWVRIDLVGAAAHGVLEKLCLLDLHASVFPPGTVACTVMDHTGVMIACLDEAPRFALWAGRSSARSFAHALEQAVASTCGPGS